MPFPFLQGHVGRFVPGVGRIQSFVVWIVLGCQETSLGIGHLAEVVLDVLGEISGGLNVVQWAEAIFLGGILTPPIPEGGWHAGG